MIWDINLIMLFFAVGDVLLVSTELRTAILQITKTSVVEGETIEFKCMISAVHREQPNKERNWFHLYKNREKVSSLPEPRGIAAITFINEDIRKNDAGNYTCMHGNQNPGDVKYISRGPPIYLNVQESPYSLVLQLDKQSVMEGMDVSFKCMIPVELRDTEQKNGSFHLYKDGSLVDSQTVPKSLPGATFSIKKVNRNDTGNYTCVYGKETIVNSANNKRSRPVYLDVTECLTSPTTTAKTQQNSSTESYGLGNDIRIFLSLGILLLLSAIVGEDFYSRQRMHHRENANGQ
ncbi:T-cell-interacting, activating receptor on myeloid cells protein 1-like isoform X2 [Polyodon spathula]|uniref:T-cell-interacting, activating receptor on myeloid cells protein 1-like isoform X2 n=1 Tax=Polyodon spathula TaxID=7913 RepID=UPI001B7F08D0|nr:T-cell-interacting, activating receptor on myeloid cells protein 1-like isoform X2 [Polyodon spathula]